MHLPFTTVNVFTTTRYVGNPLAIVRVPASLRPCLMEAQKQNIAREFNYSETTFLHEPAEGQDVADFDIFTPVSRISFAGHPTIGTALYVATHPDAYPGVKNLRANAGVIPFTHEPTAALGKVTVAIPYDVHTHQKLLLNPFTEEKSVPIVSIVKGMAFGLAQLPSLEALGQMNGPLVPAADRYKPELFLDVGSGWDVGYTGTFYYVDLGKEGNVRRLRTRGIPQHEDPGTGSASAALCCYIALKEGKEGVMRFHLTQGVEMGRQSDIFVSVKMEGREVKGVELSGQAVEVMEGLLTVD
jgi:predicted PhzF superfamily epimerase YddE/YHI9